MTERPHDRPADGDGDEHSSSGARPSRVFVWGDEPTERGLFRRLVDRLRRDEAGEAPRHRSSGEPPPTVFRPPSARAAPPDARPRRSAPPPELPPAAEGWDPPDLTLPDETGQPRRDPPAPPPAAKAPAEDAGHGPGPLYRATLQLLPGRLRPLDPDIVREEIRFVRPSGRDAAVTLGWADGEPPDHITVNHPSVEDRHARMSFVDRRWHIESLVPRSPVLVNGDPVPVDSPPRELRSGDEVRLGEASFHFVNP